MQLTAHDNAGRRQLDLAGLSLVAKPPGPVAAEVTPSRHILGMQLSVARTKEVRWLGRDITRDCAGARGLSWLPAGGDLGVRCSRTGWALSIALDPSYLAKLHCEQPAARALAERFVPWTQSSLAEAPAALLIQHLTGDRPDPLYAEGLALSVFSQVLPLVEGTHDLRPYRSMDDRVRRALDYVAEHLEDDLSISGLAAVACLSPGHFARSVKAQTGRPVWAHVQRMRSERARELIVRTRLSLSEIAVRCGFAHQGHMGRIFKREFGATPASLRPGWRCPVGPSAAVRKASERDVDGSGPRVGYA